MCDLSELKDRRLAGEREAMATCPGEQGGEEGVTSRGSGESVRLAAGTCRGQATAPAEDAGLCAARPRVTPASTPSDQLCHPMAGAPGAPGVRI